ncbi:MAG TPA: pyridine nucleotide-disulfide oxidoreductase, partial [Flavisolibacter sp.]|nr:pyridine nucleotide-disulfide oxidoreductase [Flavisolibacter sp.]
KLPLGGFGISRFLLDLQLAQLAEATGVQVVTETKVDAIRFSETFLLDIASRRTDCKQIRARVCCAAYGKRSNLDIKWKRPFLEAVDKKLDNFIGIKYHLEGDWDPALIGLHNFEDGYCGLSRIEEGRYCLCYMTTAASLKRCGNDIRRLEAEVLAVNPHLRKILATSRILDGFPVTISQINFNSKETVKDHVLMLGDAAGMITPLCGNGMSIAFHTGKLAFEGIHRYLHGSCSREVMETEYAASWNHHFAARLRTGRRLQRFFGRKALSNAFVGLFRTFPFLAGPVIRMTHGKPF